MRKSIPAILAAVSVLFGAGVASAQDKYPSKPVRILVPYAPGGATDIVSRIIGDQLRVILGQSFVTESKPGAFGIIAIEEMARSKPDGYTLMVGNVTTNAITPILHKSKMRIDYEKDVIAVANLVGIPAFLVVATKDFPVKTVAELVAYSKQNKGKLRYGHVGVGSYPHYDMELLGKAAGGLDMISIPNTAGASGLLKDLATGDMHAAFVNVASTGPMAKAGQVRPIAVINTQRLPDYPDVPTMEEAGFKDVGTMAWQGLFAPAGTPKPVLDILSKAILQAMQTQQVKDAFSKQYFMDVASKSPEEAQAWLKSELARWKKITEEVKIDLAN